MTTLYYLKYQVFTYILVCLLSMTCSCTFSALTFYFKDITSIITEVMVDSFILHVLYNEMFLFNSNRFVQYNICNFLFNYHKIKTPWFWGKIRYSNKIRKYKNETGMNV